jgi:threonine aldolase
MRRPEFFSNGSKLLIARTENGKLTPESIREGRSSARTSRYPKPRVVTLTQATEVGSVYTPDEIRAISATCKELGLNLHMDGARFSNACAFLGCTRRPDLEGRRRRVVLRRHEKRHGSG